jgi:hypothetical protein
MTENDSPDPLPEANPAAGDRGPLGLNDVHSGRKGPELGGGWAVVGGLSTGATTPNGRSLSAAGAGDARRPTWVPPSVKA